MKTTDKDLYIDKELQNDPAFMIYMGIQKEGTIY